jgi:hypothetical protein
MSSNFQKRHYIAIADCFVHTYNVLAVRPSRYWKIERQAVDDALNRIIQTFKRDNWHFDEYRFRRHIIDGTGLDLFGKPFIDK